MQLKLYIESGMDKIETVFKRFPTSIMMCLVLTIIHFFDPNPKLWVYWGFCIGAILSLSMDYWRESAKNKSRAILTTFVVYLIHIVITFVLFHFKNFSQAFTIGLLSVIPVVICSLFCLSYLRKENDIPFWHYICSKVPSAFIVALIFSATLCGGLEFILVALNNLFSLNLSGAYQNVFFICAFFIFPVLFMANLPSGSQKFIESLPAPNRLSNKLVHYLIFPLLGIFLVILYAYYISIIIHWELPKGMVSYFVSVAMAVVLFVIIDLHPARYDDERGLDKKLLKWLPLIMIPFLILMSVGIIRRISDYGLTVPRVYLALFNIWCYAICIYLFKTHCKRIIWIPVSLVLTFLITSVFPFNVSKGVELWLHHSIKVQLIQSGATTLPISGPNKTKILLNWLHSLDQSTYDKFSSRILYILDLNPNSLNDLIEGDKYDILTITRDKYNEYNKVSQTLFPEEWKDTTIRMNRGLYNKPISCKSIMIITDVEDEKLDTTNGSISFKVVPPQGDSTTTESTLITYDYTIDRELIRYAKSFPDEKLIILSNDQADLYIRYMNMWLYGDEPKAGMSIDGSMSIEGFLCVR